LLECENHVSKQEILKKPTQHGLKKLNSQSNAIYAFTVMGIKNYER